MPKFSEQRILKSKDILCSYLREVSPEDFLFKEKIYDETIRRTQLLVNENDPMYMEILNSNLNILINSAIKMSIPRIRQRFESGYALFGPDDNIKKRKEIDYPMFFIFSEREMIEYIINRQLLFLEKAQFKIPVVRYYSTISFMTVSKATGLSVQSIQDELEYARACSNIRYKKDNSYMLYALNNCNKTHEFMKYMLDSDKHRDDLFYSISLQGYSTDYEIKRIVFEGKTYYIVPVDEQAEIDAMKDIYELVIK